ncbi:hypothetical protein PIB30_050256 [Stylosanthes scabra]|uniref:Uncharacterized protein n=1 Tax=Stylosanthes scabra TaxID=79078 RepID=A0ABU6THC0_9FABA|nr:hypothetical protein [Stylosanthes scabra]
MYKKFIDVEIDSKSSIELRAKYYKNMVVKRENMPQSQQPPPPFKRIKTIVAKVKKTRGPTKCVKIHTRLLEDREEITLNHEGEAIGPTNQVAKFIIPIEGKAARLARVNDNWRWYKIALKIKHFLSYKSTNEMLKNRLKGVPETHFRKLIDYWRNEAVKKMAKQNKKNRAKQKFRHRKGPISFARVRARLAATKENNEQPTQVEMFVETRQSAKGTPLDEDTLDVIEHLQYKNAKSKDAECRAFRSIFGKEKARRVRCHGRVTTPSLCEPRIFNHDHNN